MVAWTQIAQTINYLATTAAVIVGGGWVYFKFIRGRTFARRAELSIEVTSLITNNKPVIKATVRLSNTGLSKLPLKADGKAILLYATPVANWRARRNFKWEWLMLSDIFLDHSWVESQEGISDDVMLPLDHRDGGPWLACRVQAQIWSKPSRWRRRGTTWIANVIVPIQRDQAAAGTAANSTLTTADPGYMNDAAQSVDTAGGAMQTARGGQR